MFYSKVTLDDKHSLVVKGWSTVNFIQGDYLKIENRIKPVIKDLVDIVGYQGGFVRFILKSQSPASLLMNEMVERQKKDDLLFSIVVMSDREQKFNLSKCFFSSHIFDGENHYFFIRFEEDYSIE